MNKSQALEHMNEKQSPEFASDENFLEGKPAESIMSNVDGRITSVAIHLKHKDHQTEQAFFKAVATFLKEKSDEPDFILRCIYSKRDKTARDSLERYLLDETDAEHRLVFLETEEEISDVWIRDGAVRKNNQTIVLPERPTESRKTKKDYSDLAKDEGAAVEQSDLVFEGGDVRATQDYVFVGFDSVYATIEKGGQKKVDDELIHKTVSDFENGFGKKVIVVGLEQDSDSRYKKHKGVIPTFHTDMILTPLGGKDVLVGQMEGNTQLDIIAAQLHAQGFDVSRIPFAEISNGNIIGQGSSKPKNEFYSPGQLSYNNALIEVYEGVKKAYLPEYYLDILRTNDGSQVKFSNADLDHLNKKAADIYRDKGFSVAPIPIGISIVQDRGSLNCLLFETRKV